MANALRSMGHKQKAQALLEKAVKKNPGNLPPLPLPPSSLTPPSGNAPLLVNLASNLEPPATSDKALQLFDMAIAADPSLMEAYVRALSMQLRHCLTPVTATPTAPLCLPHEKSTTAPWLTCKRQWISAPAARVFTRVWAMPCCR